jgi:penicillin-binding protein 1A
MEKLRNFYKKLRALSIFRPGVRKWTFSILAILLLILITPVAFIFAVNMNMFGKLPNEIDLKNIDNNVATEVYSADTVLLGRYYYQNRTNTSYENISPYLIDALLATEDVRFYKHEGIDFRSWMRVFIKTILLGKDTGGGSTVSQQLAKNLFGRDDESMVLTKSKEAIIAKRIESIYSKKEILTLYFNTVPFGDNIYGVETAAKRYFNKSAKTVNMQEAATLIGMLKANHQFNPRVNPDQSKWRRNVVLKQMSKYDFIGEAVADSVQELPLETDLQIITTNTGLATYFREHLRQELDAWSRNNFKEGGSPYNLYADGLRVYTTIDSKLQQYAEDAVRGQMEGLQKEFDDHWKNRKPWDRDPGILERAVKKTILYKKLKEEGADDKAIKEEFAEEKVLKYFSYEGKKEKKMSMLDSVKHHLMILHAGLLAIDPESGQVKAWVGGIDHNFFKYDHVNQNTKRQVGSTFKPVVYSAALKSGIDPCGFISSSQVAYKDNDKTWVPRNSDGEYDLKYSMKGALMNSVNTVSVKLLKRTGIEPIISLAKSMGIESEIPEVPSIALGTNNASLYEMVTAYCTFANSGRPIKPVYITSITDQEGNILDQFHADTTRDQVISDRNNAIMIEMMKNVVNHGTASKLRWKYNINNDIAGKTGTTQNNSDGWFIGISPKLVVGVWVGADDPGVRFRHTSLGQGSSTALPIFAKFFEKINADSTYRHITEAKFPPPSQKVRIMLDCAAFIEEKPSLFERLFGDQDEKKEKKNEKKVEEDEEESDGFFKGIGDLFKRKKKDN